MSDLIQHECGIAVIRLLKPLAYYARKYGTTTYGLNRMMILLEKQRNRGQDGAGVAAVKIDVPPGERYIFHSRSAGKDPLREVFDDIFSHFSKANHEHPDLYADPQWIQQNVPFAGQAILGHLRYGTHGRNSVHFCHPFVRENNWRTRNLVIAGNFNMTNNRELFELLVNLGQHPNNRTDTLIVLEKIGHFLDEENDRLYHQFKNQQIPQREISEQIAEHIDVSHVLRPAAESFDGGYVIAGMLGHGDTFAMRDPAGIRPAYYYVDDELVVVASERPAIQTVFATRYQSVREIAPGHALIVRANGRVTHEPILTPAPRKSACSFERIYFSRGTDSEIYRERKELGRTLTDRVLDDIQGDLKHTVFSFIPNTSEVAFLGMVEGLKDYQSALRQKQILEAGDKLSPQRLAEIFEDRLRIEKLMNKDVKLRTFIAQDTGRNEMVSLVYDTTYGIVERGIDTIVVVDDSIVRGTTLRESILRILDRLGPRRIVVCSSAPQIRYPDCYGIDMSKLGDFVAFEAMMALIHDTGNQALVDDVYQACKLDEETSTSLLANHVKALYNLFDYDQISRKIAQLLTPPDLKAELSVIYQTIDGLHAACPNHTGDWYFTGNYPTPGGNRVANRSFINYIENLNERAY